MRKLIVVVILIMAIYYFVFSNNGGVEKPKVTNQLPSEDRVLDYDIKYKDAVKDINEAVDLNLEQKKSMDDLLENIDSLEETHPE